MNKLKKMKQDYEETEIPTELEAIVKSSIRLAKKARKPRYMKQWAIGATAAIVLFIGSINMSTTFAQAMANVPGLGSLVEVFTIQQLMVDEGKYQADIKTPEVSGLKDEQLQSFLNEKYIAENKALFDQFQLDVEELKKTGDGNLGVHSGYDIITDTDQLLSIARYEVMAVGSSFTMMKYDTVDKQNSILITLPSLFIDDQYVEVVSSYLLSEMKKQMATDKNIVYFLAEDEEAGGFEQILPDQPFYITNENKLVVSFHKYEVGPGSLGVVTFEIPTNVVKNLLVSDTYIN